MSDTKTRVASKMPPIPADCTLNFRVTGPEFRFLRETCGFNRRAYIRELKKAANGIKKTMCETTLYYYEATDEELKPYFVNDLKNIAGEELYLQAFELLKKKREKENAGK